jgi:hypothetical protein
MAAWKVGESGVNSVCFDGFITCIAPCRRDTFFARAKKVSKAFYLEECAPDEAFALRSEPIRRAPLTVHPCTSSEAQQSLLRPCGPIRRMNSMLAGCIRGMEGRSDVLVAIGNQRRDAAIANSRYTWRSETIPGSHRRPSFCGVFRVCISPLGDTLSLLRDKDFLQGKVRKGSAPQRSLLAALCGHSAGGLPSR